MWQNMGSVDRVLRIVLGLGIMMLVRFGPETAWGYLGLVPFVTGLVGWCPLYSVLGISSKPRAPASVA